MAAGAGKWPLAIKFLIQIGPDPLPAPTGVLGLELALERLVLENGLWLLSFFFQNGPDPLPAPTGVVGLTP